MIWILNLTYSPIHCLLKPNAMTSSRQLDRSKTITRSTATSDTFDVQNAKEEQHIVLPDYYKLNPEAAERKRIKYLQRAEAITAESQYDPNVSYEVKEMVYGYKLGRTGRSFNHYGLIVGDQLIHLMFRHKRGCGGNGIVGYKVKMEKSTVDNDTSIYKVGTTNYPPDLVRNLGMFHQSQY